MVWKTLVGQEVHREDLDSVDVLLTRSMQDIRNIHQKGKRALSFFAYEHVRNASIDGFPMYVVDSLVLQNCRHGAENNEKNSGVVVATRSCPQFHNATPAQHTTKFHSDIGYYMVLMAVLFFKHDHQVVCVICAHDISKRRDKEPYSNPRLHGETNEMWSNHLDPNRNRYTGVFKMRQKKAV